jgi:uncharacterized protein YecE (DUF72 family)
MRIYVGCCGFAEGMKKYFTDFETIEIQKTFYKIPQKKTLVKWKNLAPKNFIFNLKAFQGITHTYKSPTWRRFGKELPGKKENFGNLQPTKEVFNSWKETLNAAKILNAKVVLIQTPTRFKDTTESLKNAEKFFKRIIGKIQIAFEPRGWSAENVNRICKKFDLIHCVDPFKEDSRYFGKEKIAYFRLHGSYEGGRINYKHKYSTKELKELKNKIKNLKAKEVFILFNNIYMLKDALKFKELIQ